MDTQQLAELKRYILNIEDSLRALKRIAETLDARGGDFQDDPFRQPLPRNRMRDPLDASFPPNPLRPPSQRPPLMPDLPIQAPSRRVVPMDQADTKPSQGLYPPFAPARQAAPAADTAQEALPPVASKAVPAPVQAPVEPKPVAETLPPAKPISEAKPEPQESPITDQEDTAASADIPSIEGSFDGTHLVTPTGEKIEVPQNYAAKTRILYGDIVKMYEENGEKKFKVTTKQPRKKVVALTTKKEGKWYVLTGLGAYKISDGTADFNKLEVNQEVNVLVPENNLTVPFAAFDEVIKPVVQETAHEIPTTLQKSSEEPVLPVAQSTPSVPKPVEGIPEASPKPQAPAPNASRKIEDYDLV